MNQHKLNRKTIAISLVSLLVAIIGIIQLGPMIMTNSEIQHIQLTILPEPQNANAMPIENAGCLPSSITALGEQPDIKVRTAHVLPLGYDLKAVDYAERGWVTLFYWDNTMCPFEFNSHDYSLKGVITITKYYQDPSRGTTNASDYVNSVLSDPDNKLYAKWHTITLGGNLAGTEAVGTEPFEGKSSTYLDGKLVDEKPIPSPSMVYFIHKDDNAEYRISGNLPLDDLIKVAESIK
ncbi:MAG TPA: hypothetical protein VLD38_08090 [Nitrosopumilaceae archaeon]|nr:hypothetical protein [Nitrosopumilaceae archaeon]